MDKFVEKYASYGEVVGKVILDNLQLEEIEVLEGFFQKNYHGKAKISISARDLEKALASSRFSHVTPEKLLILYVNDELTSKAEQKEAFVQTWVQMIQDIRVEYEETFASKWLADVLEMKKYGYQYLQREYRENLTNLEKVKKKIRLGCAIINGFPIRENRLEYLPIFATQFKSNPHAFDEKMEYGKFLLQLLIWESERQQGLIWEGLIFASLEKQRLYLNAGILRDDISNYIVISGIEAVKLNGEIHQGMAGFFAEADTVQVPLSVLATWKQVRCIDKELYIVENPSVYAKLSRRWKGKKSIMCMNGQPKLSSLVFLDLLKEEKVHLYYAGDFDPEGLLIAQKLQMYYQGEFSYWHMDLEDYLASQSENKLSAKRLASLEKIREPLLKKIVEEMKLCKLAGYQEKIIERYVEER